MGLLRYLYDLDYDPSDTSNPAGTYSPYDFIPAGKTGIPNLSMTRDFARRESIQVIPGADGVLDGNGRIRGPMDRRDFSVSFRVIVGPAGNLDAAYDLLAAQVAPGVPQRLVYQTDSGALWFTVGYNPSIKHTLTAENKGLTAYADFVVTWRIRPDWRWRFSESAEVFHSASAFVAASTFGNAGTTTIDANPKPFAVAATGTAGLDLPTIPDTGPTITIIGPAGGDGGLIVRNTSVTVVDATGTAQAMQFAIPFKLPTANDSVTLRFASGAFVHNGAFFRPVKPNYQRDYIAIRNGITNAFVVVAQGATVVTGGKITVDWYRKRA